jgi:S-adenosylmethionine-diacylglycerol 3-amino-3-carboxypropyl transferase
VITRTELPGAVAGQLYFAQVREDPRLELTAFTDYLDEPIVVVTSGGCTALSLIAAGATDVTGVDLNRTQNHVAEFKAVAVARLGPRQATAVLGGSPAAPGERARGYQRIRPHLSASARAYFDARLTLVTDGILNAGATERLMRLIARAISRLVHPRERMDRLLAQTDLAAQRALYDSEWNTSRWWLLFRLLCNRLVLRRTYDPAFFEHVANPSFARHFHGTAERALRDLPVGDNYFLHFMFRGHFTAAARPPYLDPASGNWLAGTEDRLTLVDGGFLNYLRGRPDASIGGFALSNICEWLTSAQTDELFAEIVRTAKPEARLVFRNFVGWTDVPQRWRAQVVVDVPLGDKLIAQDRSLCQRRIAVCTISKATA